MADKNQQKAFDNLTEHYQKQDWIDKPNIFATEVSDFIPKSGTLLCLGDGQGQDSRFFAEKGYTVIASDLSDKALAINKQKIDAAGITNISVQKIDLLDPLPFDDNSIDIVYAHLSLHYFDAKMTHKIFDEIFRVLKQGGYICVFTNSMSDPEVKEGTEIEPGYYFVDGVKKRFFSTDSLQEFTDKFETILLDDDGETYKDAAVGIHNLIRFIGRKSS